jgi:hypothetical protein
MATNSRTRKEKRDYRRGYQSGLENRNPSGGNENPSAAYRYGRRVGSAARFVARRKN